MGQAHSNLCMDVAIDHESWFKLSFGGSSTALHSSQIKKRSTFKHTSDPRSEHTCQHLSPHAKTLITQSSVVSGANLTSTLSLSQKQRGGL